MTVARADKRSPSSPQSPSSPRSINATLTTGYYDVLAAAAADDSDNCITRQETPDQPARKLTAVSRLKWIKWSSHRKGRACCMTALRCVMIGLQSTGVLYVFKLFFSSGPSDEGRNLER